MHEHTLILIIKLGFCGLLLVAEPGYVCFLKGMHDDQVANAYNVHALATFCLLHGDNR